jgi:hypothetical protein
MMVVKSQCNLPTCKNPDGSGKNRIKAHCFRNYILLVYSLSAYFEILKVRQ